MAHINLYRLDDAVFHLQRNQILIELIADQLHLNATKCISKTKCLERIDYLVDIYLQQSKEQFELLTETFSQKSSCDRRE